MPETALMLDEATQDLLFREAHTANAFSAEPVSDEQLRAVYELVKYGPTAFNQSPLRVVLVRSAEARERLVAHMSDGNKAKTLSAPLTAVLAADYEFHEELPRLVPHFPGVKDAFFSAREVREGSAAFNSALQMAYFIVGIRAAGLAAGPMTGYDAAGIDKEFFADGDHSVISVINIGKPGEDAFKPRAPRLPYDEVVTTV
jgi:3-hydroxypropanoate dehydrogenase